jgi:hypothetical protein
MAHRSHPAPSNNAPGTGLSPPAWQTSRPISRTPSRTSTPTKGSAKRSNGAPKKTIEAVDDSDEDFDEMDDRRPTLHRPPDGRSHQPLLHKDDEERGRTGYSSPVPERPPTFSRRSTMRSRSPDTQAKLATRKKYTYAAFFLGLSLISFVIQTETAVYIQHELGWNKAYCML